METCVLGLVFLVIPALVFLWIEARQEAKNLEKDKRIQQWCDWLKTLDLKPGTAICRNEEELFWANNMWGMFETGETIPGLGVVVRRLD